jgi:hypothetical protein
VFLQVKLRVLKSSCEVLVKFCGAVLGRVLVIAVNAIDLRFPFILYFRSKKSALALPISAYFAIVTLFGFTSSVVI